MNKTLANKDTILVSWPGTQIQAGEPLRFCPVWDRSPISHNWELGFGFKLGTPGIKEACLPFLHSRSAAASGLLTGSKPWRQTLASPWRTLTQPMGSLDPVPQWGISVELQNVTPSVLWPTRKERQPLRVPKIVLNHHKSWLLIDQGFRIRTQSFFPPDSLEQGQKQDL